MRRIIILLLAVVVAFTGVAQTQKKQVRKKNTTTKVRKKKSMAKKKNTVEYTNSSIKGLRNQRAGVQRKIREQERLLRANKADVKKRLGDLMVLNSEIDKHKKSIDVIEKDISQLDGNIDMLKNQLATLDRQLQDRKSKYIKSMRYIARKRSFEDRLMFIFSAKDFAQMYRRMRFVREYAAYQRTQGEMIKEKQTQIENKNKELNRVRGNKNILLAKGKEEHAALQGKHAEQEKMVSSLRKQQKTIQSIISDQRKKDAALNAKIDKLVAEEVAKARARAEAEARRKAAEAAAAAKRRQEELARKKAAAEAAARENERRVAEAKAREERLKAERKAAESKSEAERERAERAVRDAEADRIAAERKARVEEERHKNEIARARKNVSDAMALNTEERKLNGSFERNKGRLPMPITGSYKIVSHFGQYAVDGLKNVKLDNKGINILGNSGASARSIFDGEVSAVFGFGGTMVVMVRHGKYISVYCNLKSVCVRRGQRVSTRQALGTIGADNILQFQLRRETVKLNPETWLGR